MRLCDYLDRGAELYPDNICLDNGQEQWRYEGVRTLSHRIALGLRASGLQKGGRVAVYSPNNALAYVCIIGISRADCSWVLLNARNSVDEVIHTLTNSDTDWLFYHSEFEGNIEKIRAAAPGIAHLVCIDKPGAHAPKMEDWADAYDGLAPDLPEESNAVSIVGSSGGTTGRPKSILLSHRAVETLVATFFSCMPMETAPAYLMVAPMTHAAGVCSFPMLPLGGTLYFMNSTGPEAIMQMIDQHRITHLFLPPTVIYMMLSHPKVRDYDYSSLKNFIYASAPMSAEKLAQAIEVFGPVMTQTYGQMEAPMVCTFFSPAQHAEALNEGKVQRLLSCGRATPYTRVAIMDEEGNLLPSGESGEIVVRGGLVMNGYYNNPEATREASAHGWHHTGDIGNIDKDGYVYIVDRKKDMIITGGFNVFPTEIEQVIWSYEGVQDCAVIGVPDEKWGEAVTAVVQPQPGAKIDTEDLIAMCKTSLGSIKAPKRIEIWDDLPRSAVGKVLKKEIRAKFWEGRERMV